MRVSFKRSRKKPDQTLVKAGELYYEYKLNSQQHLEYDRFFHKIYTNIQKIYTKKLSFYKYISLQKNSFLTVPFFYTTVYMCVCNDFKIFIFYSDLLNYCKALSTEKYKRYINILLLLLFACVQTSPISFVALAHFKGQQL